MEPFALAVLPTARIGARPAVCGSSIANGSVNTVDAPNARGGSRNEGIPLAATTTSRRNARATVTAEDSAAAVEMELHLAAK